MPGHARGPLRDGRRRHRPPRPRDPARPLRGGRGGGDRRARRQPPGQQLAARGARLRRARRGGHGRRTRRPSPAPTASDRRRRPRGRRPRAARRGAARRTWERLGLERDAARPARAARARSTAGAEQPGFAPADRAAAETRNLVDVAPGHGRAARSSARRAAARHFRTDFPDRDDAALPRPHAAGRAGRRASSDVEQPLQVAA